LRGGTSGKEGAGALDKNKPENLKKKSEFMKKQATARGEGAGSVSPTTQTTNEVLQELIDALSDDETDVEEIDAMSEEEKEEERPKGKGKGKAKAKATATRKSPRLATATAQAVEVDAKTGQPLIDLDKRKRENTATSSTSKKQEMDPVRAELYRYLKEKYPKLNEADIFRYIVSEDESPRGIVDALEQAYMDNVDDDTPIDVEADKAFIDKLVDDGKMDENIRNSKKYRDFMRPENRKFIKANRKKARATPAEVRRKKKDEVVDEKRKSRIDEFLKGEIDSQELYDSTVPEEKKGAKFSTKKKGKSSERGRKVAQNRQKQSRLKQFDDLRERYDAGDIDDEEATDDLDRIFDDMEFETMPEPPTMSPDERDAGTGSGLPPKADVRRAPDKNPDYFEELRKIYPNQAEYDKYVKRINTEPELRAEYDEYVRGKTRPVYTERDDSAPMSESKQAEQTPDPVKEGTQSVPINATKAELIPKERLSAEGKSVKELLSDILYFFQNFPKQLKSIRSKWNKLPMAQKKNEAVLKRYHGMIVGTLQPEGSKADEGKEAKVGIVVDAEQYIEMKMREIMLDSRFANMQPAELIDVNEGIKKKKASDMGAFEVRQGLRGGKSFIQREPVYKAISTSQPEQVAVQMRPAGKATQPKRFSLMPAKQMNLATTAKKFNNANPFARSVPTITLKVLK